MGPTELWTIISKTLNRVARNCRKDPRFRDEACGYSIWIVVRIFILCVLEGFSGNVLYEKLKTDKGFRRRWGLPLRLIRRSQFYKRLKTASFLRALLEVLRASAVGALKGLGEKEVRIVAMDLTRIESDPDRDRWGAWGFGSHDFFWGYKLGLILSEQGVVLGMSLMRANWNEFKVNGRLLKQAHTTILTAFGRLPVTYLVCDSGFDGESTFEGAHRELHAPVLCPPKRERNPKAKHAQQTLRNARSQSPHRFRDQQLWHTDLWAHQIYRKRTVVEQVNGQLKDSPIRINEVPRCRRGVRRLLPLCLAKLIIYNLALNVNIANGREIRHIRDLVA